MPGFLLGRRYEAVPGEPRYFNFYLTQSADVLKSAAYIERLDHPTPMTRTIMSEIFKDMIRTVCHRTLRLGAMRGAAAVAVRFTERSDQDALKAALEELMQDKAVACGEIWSAVDAERISGVRGGAAARRRPQDRGMPLRRDAAGDGSGEDRRRTVAQTFPAAAIGVYRLLCEIRPPRRPPSRRGSRPRSASIEISPFGVSRCQKVQPLQASRPCASAPMRWIEPTASPSATAPSARTSALCFFLASTSLAPAEIMPALDQRRERHARRLARGHERRQRRRFQRLHRGDALLGGLGVGRIALDADVAAAEVRGDRAGGAGAVERVEHQVVGPRTRQDDAGEQRLGLLRRMQLLAVAALEPLLAGAERQGPVGADLDVFVAGFQRLVVEGVARALRRGSPRSSSHGRW